MGKQKSGKSALSVQPKSDSQTFSIVLFYCLLIIFSPIITFFLSKYALFDPLEFSSVKSNIFSAVAAVVALHLALGGYLYRAYFEAPSHETKQD